jgi:hypothetical protein
MLKREITCCAKYSELIQVYIVRAECIVFSVKPDGPQSNHWKGKGKFHPRRDHEDTEGKQR